MRKVVKVLFLLILMSVFVFAFSTKVKAADEFDYSGYEELPSDEKESKTPATASTTPENEKNADDKNDQKVVTTNKANTATTSHIQAGSFEMVALTTLGGVALVAIGIGYNKYKKYNF